MFAFLVASLISLAVVHRELRRGRRIRPKRGRSRGTRGTAAILAALFVPALLSPAASQSDPVGGWRSPLWEVRGVQSDDYLMGDLTGDGYPDLIVNALTGGKIEVFDGRMGGLVFRLPDTHLGFGIARLGDLDGDGQLDLVVSNRWHSLGDPHDHGVVEAFSGVTFQSQWIHYGAALDSLGSPLHVLDLDSDGEDEVIVGARDGVVALDGRTGSHLWRRRKAGCFRLAGFFDAEGDGHLDLLVGETLSTVCGASLALLDGQSGVTRWQVPTNLDTRLGIFVLHDLDGDHVVDVVLHDARPVGEVSAYRAHSGVDGRQLWEVDETRFGELQHWPEAVEDFTGDGVPDLLLRATVPPGAVFLADGVTGQTVWSRPGTSKRSTSEVRLGEFDLDGLPDVALVHAGFFDEVEAIRGHDGASLWRRNAPGDATTFIDLGDANGDGLDDVLTRAPNETFHLIGDGQVALMDGQTGAEVWRRTGSRVHDKIGFQALFVDKGAGSADAVLVWAGAYSHLDTQVSSLDPRTGAALWSTASPLPVNEQFVRTVELDGPPGLEILASGANDMLCIDQSGEALWQVEWNAPRDAGPTPAPCVFPDQTGDGYAELLVHHHRVWRNESGPALLSGATGDYRPGIRASDRAISRATGGRIDVELHFPPEEAGNAYQLLVSSSGTGPTDVGNGLFVPLTRDAWLRESWLGNHPPIIVAPTGNLDLDSRADLALDAAPNQLAASVVGLTLHYAGVSGPAAGAWRFSSAALRLQIMP